MQCIAVLDYDHLNDGAFLLNLAKSVSHCPNFHPLIVHGSSANTERIIQQGVMRGEADIQNIKTLNHQLVNFFADESVAAIGIHGYQKKAVTYKQDQLSTDAGFFDNLPSVSIILSTLIWNEETKSVRKAELPKLISSLKESLDIKPVYIFSLQDKADEHLSNTADELYWDQVPEDFTQQHIPGEFHNFQKPLRIISAQSFGHENRKSRSTIIHN